MQAFLNTIVAIKLSREDFTVLLSIRLNIIIYCTKTIINLDIYLIIISIRYKNNTIYCKIYKIFKGSYALEYIGLL